MAALRQGTRPRHDAVEAAAPLARLFAADYALAEYAALLARLAAFYAAAEPPLLAGLPPDLAVLLGPPRRAGRLRADLAALGRAAPAPAPAWPAPADLPSRLGALYVLEGASLGGRLIHRRLIDHFGAAAAGAVSFYAGEGKATAARWAAFGALVDGALRDPADIAAALAAADATFDRFGAALAA